jgi:hypothetical protein
MNKTKNNVVFDTDIMVNDYNYSLDCRNWEDKHGDDIYNLTKRERKKIMPVWMRK